MAEPTITHDDLLLYACGDLDAEGQAMIRNAVDRDPELRKELDVLLAGLDAVRPRANGPDDSSDEPRLSARGPPPEPRSDPDRGWPLGCARSSSHRARASLRESPRWVRYRPSDPVSAGRRSA